MAQNAKGFRDLVFELKNPPKTVEFPFLPLNGISVIVGIFNQYTPVCHKVPMWQELSLFRDVTLTKSQKDCQGTYTRSLENYNFWIT